MTMKYRGTSLSAARCLNGVLFLLVLTGLDGCKFRDVKGAQGPMLATKSAYMGLRFEPNQGQALTDSDYLTGGPGYFVSLKATEATLTLKKQPVTSNKRIAYRGRLARALGKHLFADVREPAPVQATLRVQLIGANSDAPVRASHELSGRSNYISGPDSTKWRTNIAGYSEVNYQAVYPGIDLVYHGDNKGE